jgi:hypothetical protein
MDLNYWTVTHMSSDDRKKLLTQMGSCLEENLPEKIEEIYPYWYAVAQFLEALIIDSKVIRHKVFGMALHDLVICITKGWRIPSAMIAGLLNRTLEPFYQYLYHFDNEGYGKKFKLFHATLGFIDSILEDLINKKSIDSWKLWYLRGIAVYFTPYGDRRVPGMETETYELPVAPKPDFFFKFDLDDDRNVRLIQINSKGDKIDDISTSPNTA